MPSDDVRRAVTSGAVPSQVREAHLVLARLLSTDAVAQGWHLTHAATAPSHEAADLALATARSLQSTGHPGSARTMLEHAARLAPVAGDRAARLVEAAATAFASGSPRDGQELLDKAHDADMDPATTLLSELVRATFTRGGIAVDADQLRSVLDTLRECALGPVAFSVLVAAGGSWATADVGEIDDPSWLPGAAHDAVVAIRQGDLPSASRHLRSFSDELAAHGLRGVEAHTRVLLAGVSARTGDLATAAEQARCAGELAWVTGQREWRTRAAVIEALVAARRGTTDAPRLVEAAHRSVICEEGEARALVELAHAVSLTAAEEWADGLALLLKVASGAVNCPAVLDLGLLGHLAEAALQVGRRAVVAEVVARTAESAPRCATGAALVDLQYARALLASDAEADACFEDVQSLSDACWPWVRARSDLARGKVLRRRRRIAEARAHLLSAQRLFQAIGSPAWERRAGEELRAAGWREPGTGGTRHDNEWTRLSPQEREIVRLAAEGLTNRQIGERLFLSQRTIGAHLYHVFPKLDVTSRTQLVRIAQAS